MSVASIVSNPSTSKSLKADSGASKNFIREDDSGELVDVQSQPNGPKAKLPNNEYISPNKNGYLPFGNFLSPAAKAALVYPSLRNASLLSIG